MASLGTGRIAGMGMNRPPLEVFDGLHRARSRLRETPASCMSPLRSDEKARLTTRLRKGIREEVRLAV